MMIAGPMFPNASGRIAAPNMRNVSRVGLVPPQELAKPAMKAAIVPINATPNPLSSKLEHEAPVQRPRTQSAFDEDRRGSPPAALDV